MWRILLLFSLSIVIYANNENKFIGTWTQIVYYPADSSGLVCTQYIFEKDHRNIRCNCTDGETPKLMKISMLKKEGNVTRKITAGTFPMLRIGSEDEVVTHVTCTCGVFTYNHRVVGRMLSADYFVMYETLKHGYTAAEPNDATLFAKRVPSLADMTSMVLSVEDLKKRNGVVVCVSDLNP